MGTSNAFKGSGGKVASDLRDAIADWLGDDSAPPKTGESDQQSDGGAATGNAPQHPLNPDAIAPIMRLWRNTAGGSGGGGPSGGRTSSDGKSGRSSGGMRRTIARVSGPAGRAGSLARAYAVGDRDVLQSAGLDYDVLSNLGDPLEVGLQICAVAFGAQPDGSLEDSEARMIVAELVAWILDPPAGTAPAPDAIVRYSIELMIFRSTLVEVGYTIRREQSALKRREAEGEIRRAAQVLASRVRLDSAGAAAADIGNAIESGVRQLKAIFGEQE